MRRRILKTFQATARAAGLDVFKASKEPRWSHTVSDYYPIDPRPRWRRTAHPYALLTSALERDRPSYEDYVRRIVADRAFLHEIPQTTTVNSGVPYWKNNWFTALDGAGLITLLRWKKPRTYLEIGSGMSTLFAHHAVVASELDTTIISLDPHPRRDIDRLCDEVIRRPLESCDLSLFDRLEPGDFLFFDGSHRLFTNSDVAVFFFEVLPRLKPGVLVQIHDVFLPDEYPEAWSDRLYNEQYILAAMMLFQDPPFRIVAPNYFISCDSSLGAEVRRAFEAPRGVAPIPFVYPTEAASPGASFWLETRRVDLPARANRMPA